MVTMLPDEEEGRPGDYTETADQKTSHDQATSTTQSNGIAGRHGGVYADAWERRSLMPEERTPGRDHPTGGNSHNANTPKARRQAAPMAAAHAETVRIKNDALDSTLAHILRTVPMPDDARARIAGLLRQNSGDSNEG